MDAAPPHPYIFFNTNFSIEDPLPYKDPVYVRGHKPTSHPLSNGKQICKQNNYNKLEAAQQIFKNTLPERLFREAGRKLSTCVFLGELGGQKPLGVSNQGLIRSGAL